MAITTGYTIKASDIDSTVSTLETKIESNTTYQIGDIIYSGRTDLGDEWLLCNGDAVSKDDYPDLVEAIYNSDNILFPNEFDLSEIFTTIKGLKCLNGYIVIFGQYAASNTSYSSRIAYANSSNLSNWSYFTPSTASYSIYIEDVSYYNGLWVYLESYYSSYYYKRFWYYSSTSKPGQGTKNSTELSSADYSYLQYTTKIATNGSRVILCNYNYCYYFSSKTSTSFSEKNHTGFYPDYFEYDNNLGYFIAMGSRTGSSAEYFYTISVSTIGTCTTIFDTCRSKRRT